MIDRPVLATYRLQLSGDFGFAKAQSLLAYFASLGISHLYLSPIFATKPGSQHGYHVTDTTLINPQLGGEDGLRALAAAAHRLGLGLIVDIVPNHQAANIANSDWAETLMLGAKAPTARLFDIDWWAGRITLPLLGTSMQEVLRDNHIRLRLNQERGLLVAAYFDQEFPLRPRSVATFLETLLPHQAEAWQALEKAPDKRCIARARAGLRNLDPSCAAALEVLLAEQCISTVLKEQHWRLVASKRYREALSYRRFFNITDLVGIRVEDAWVFEHTHRTVLSLVADGTIDGLRIDHIDGLADPEAYLQRLRRAVGANHLIVVEKILARSEVLRAWPIDGSTGYDRLNDINGLFVDAAGYRRLDSHLEAQSGRHKNVAARLLQTKHEVVEATFASEIMQLVDVAQRVWAARRLTQRPAREDIRKALVALVACCPVYRTYATPRGFTAQDRAVWHETLAAVARHYEPRTHAVAKLILCAVEDAKHAADFDLQTRLQQLTGPAMAKGLEDTEFYRSIALLSVNEVGGDLTAPGREIADFHARSQAAARRRDLLPLATHDCKRGADARARLNLLSHDGDCWIGAVRQWSHLSQDLQDAALLDDWDQELVFQTLFAAWPLCADRCKASLTKALREAKRQTTWEAPNEAYEQAVLHFAERLLTDPSAAPFRTSFASFVAALNPAARLNGLAQTILQLTLPGIPDIYWGTEFWDHALVDPDNRRPVDWAARQAALVERPPVLLHEDLIGTRKLHVIHDLLQLRHRHAEIFAASTYHPLDLPEAPPRFVGFERRSADMALLVVVPTRVLPLCGRMSPGPLPNRAWTSAFAAHPLDRCADSTIILSDSWPFVVATASIDAVSH